jgi:AhpD family alkylhydroperoxidase
MRRSPWHSVDGMAHRSQAQDVLPDTFKRLVGPNSHIEREAAAHGIELGLLELVKVRASQINGCGYCTDMHATDALAHGVPQRVLNAVAVWAETELFSEQERAALELTEAMSRLSQTQHVPDDVYERARKAFTEEQLAVVVWAASLIQTFNALNVTVHRPLRD